MAWVAVDENGREIIIRSKPKRFNALRSFWWLNGAEGVELPKGSIKKLIGRTLSWADEPVELTEDEEDV
jgi:hypothetical protein